MEFFVFLLEKSHPPAAAVVPLFSEPSSSSTCLRSRGTGTTDFGTMPLAWLFREEPEKFWDFTAKILKIGQDTVGHEMADPFTGTLPLEMGSFHKKTVYCRSTRAQWPKNLTMIKFLTTQNTLSSISNVHLIYTNQSYTLQ